MNILAIHNFYTQGSGEDAVFSAEKALLQERGHGIVEFVRHNAEIYAMSYLGASVSTLWSRDSMQALRRLIQTARPDVAHFHNTFLLISPASYYACNEYGIPVIQTLHNYRLLCPNALLFRNGRVCEECLGKFVPWPGVLHRCYRHSRAATAVVAAMLAVHRLLRTWERTVDVFIALTEFARQKFIQGGLPAARIVVKPNFIHPDPGPGPHDGGYALFVGRLSSEKGIRTLLAAWEQLGSGVPLKIVGDGPLASEVARACESSRKIEWLGRVSASVALSLMGGALLVILPSECYENFPRVIVEAYAKGTPVIASNLGALAELVEDGRTGLRFRPGDPRDLAAKIEWAWTHPHELAQMGREARREYEEKYTAERNYEQLMAVYQLAQRFHRQRELP